MSSEDNVKTLEAICRKPENALCADCGNKCPSWASIDLGVLICLNCSGAHRALGPTTTRVRSTKLDEWQKSWIPFITLGNQLCNQYWEWNLDKNKKPCSNSSQQYINGFVVDKYLRKKYANPKGKNPVEDVRQTYSPQKTNSFKPIQKPRIQPASEKKKGPDYQSARKIFSQTTQVFFSNNFKIPVWTRPVPSSAKVIAHESKEQGNNPIATNEFIDFSFHNVQVKKNNFQQFNTSFAGSHAGQRCSSHHKLKTSKPQKVSQSSSGKKTMKVQDVDSQFSQKPVQTEYSFQNVFTNSFQMVRPVSNNLTAFGIL